MARPRREDATHHDAVLKHIVVVVAPLSRRTRGRGALEDQRGHQNRHPRRVGGERLAGASGLRPDRWRCSRASAIGREGKGPSMGRWPERRCVVNASARGSSPS
jgi:hypothetical protein